MTRRRPRDGSAQLAIQRFADSFGLGATFAILLFYFPLQLLLARTTATGGDTGAHVYASRLMRSEFLPSGRVSGWSQGWFAGFPAFHFYVPLVAVFQALLSSDHRALRPSFLLQARCIRAPSIRPRQAGRILRAIARDGRGLRGSSARARTAPGRVEVPTRYPWGLKATGPEVFEQDVVMVGGSGLHLVLENPCGKGPVARDLGVVVNHRPGGVRDRSGGQIRAAQPTFQPTLR